MMLKPLSLAAAGLAVATQAFLLPPEVTQSDIDIVNSLAAGVDAYPTPPFALVNVSCPGCLLLGNSRRPGAGIASDRASHLSLNFTIDHAVTPDTLLVNNFPLYPRANPFLYTLTAPVIPDGCVRSANREPRSHISPPWPTEELGYQLSVGQRVMNADDGLALYELTLQVIEVGGVFVDRIPAVQITLVKDINTGSLAIGEVTKVENTTPAPEAKEDECTSFVCKWMAIVEDSMAKVTGKPCHGKMRGGAEGPRPHHGGHHHHKGHPNTMHGGSRHHRWGHHRSWSQLFKNVVQHIVLPIAVGIVAGVCASLFGMMVGTLVVTVWRTLFRRSSQQKRSRSHSPSKASEAAAAAAELEEKSGLMEHQEPPPSYSDESVSTPPAYEEESVPKTDV